MTGEVFSGDCVAGSEKRTDDGVGVDSAVVVWREAEDTSPRVTLTLDLGNNS